MADLGDLGGDVPAAREDTFRWYGQTIRVHPDLTDAAAFDLAEAATTAAVVADGGEVGSPKDMFRRFIHPDDFALWWDTGRANRADAATYATCVARLVTGLSGRPTVQPAGSSDGLPPTGPKSVPDVVEKAMQAAADGHNPNAEILLFQAARAQQVS